MIKKENLKLDHITVLARTLEEGVAHIRDMLDIEMPAGGAHPRMGTHNKLLSLGADCFLEVIAINPEARPPERPRWFDLDQFDRGPTLGTWVLRTGDIQAALPGAHPESGCATEITRGELNWLISIPKDGSMPLDGTFPALIEWPEGEHPAARMVDLGCRLRSLTIEHPAAKEIDAIIGGRIDRDMITIRSGVAKSIRAEIDTPDGMKVLT